METHLPAPARRYTPLMMALVLAGCGGGGASDSSAVAVASGVLKVPTTPAAVATPAPTPTATPTPVVAPVMAMPDGTAVTTTSLAGLSPVASGIKVADYLQRSWGTGAIPDTMAPDVVGAFRFQCVPSHNAYDDPIVFPGQPGKSHLHTFFGNTGTNANSTYASLRTSGGSTCNDILNRSAYWVPAMMNGRGKVVMPNVINIYYKRRPTNDPECQRMGKACVALPRGLRLIMGYNMARPTDATTTVVSCVGTGATAGAFHNIAQAAKGCPVGASLQLGINSPWCWNGTELDSVDHRSHLAYPSYGNWGYLKCPATHPYVLPQLSIGVYYTTDATLDRSGNEAADANTWYLSSDRMPGMAASVPGTTFHADWFGAWEDSVMAIWMANCIDKLLSCSGGDLGQGQQIKTTNGYKYPSTTVLADIPVKPA